MNFTIPRDELFRVISKVKGIPNRSSSMPVTGKEDGGFSYVVMPMRT